MSLPWVFTILIRTGSIQTSLKYVSLRRLQIYSTAHMWRFSSPFPGRLWLPQPFRGWQPSPGKVPTWQNRRVRPGDVGPEPASQHPVYVTGPAIIFILLILFTILLWYSSAILVRSLFTRYGYVTRYVTMALAYPHIVVTPITTFTSTFAHFVFN